MHMCHNKIFITILQYTLKICTNDPIENKLFRYMIPYIKNKKNTLEKDPYISQKYESNDILFSVSISFSF